MTDHVLDASDGMASGFAWRKGCVSYLPPDDTPGYPRTALGDAFDQFSPMALPVEMCDRIRQFAEERCRQIRDDLTDVWALGVRLLDEAPTDRCALTRELVAANPDGAQIDDDIMDAVAARIHAANDRWWGFDIDAVTMIVKRYKPGGRHAAHGDYTIDAHGQGRKLACSIPLSDPAEYADGRLILRYTAGPDYPWVGTPNGKGSFIIFPGWTIHEVEPVTKGERWVMLLNAYGPRFR